MSMIPRSLRSFVPPIPLISSSLTLSVRVMVALRVWGLASVPISSSPCTMIHSVVSSRSIVCEAQFAVDRQTAQRRRTDVEEHIHVRSNGDLVAFGWAPSCPARWLDQTSASVRLPALRHSEPERQRIRCRAGMREGATQEGTSDVAYSRNQPPYWKR